MTLKIVSVVLDHSERYLTTERYALIWFYLLLTYSPVENAWCHKMISWF